MRLQYVNYHLVIIGISCTLSVLMCSWDLWMINRYLEYGGCVE